MSFMVFKEIPINVVLKCFFDILINYDLKKYENSAFFSAAYSRIFDTRQLLKISKTCLGSVLCHLRKV
jgi:hypothetical protein